MWYLQLCSIFSKVALALWVFLWFHINFRVLCLSTLKNTINILRGIVIYLWIALSNMDSLISNSRAWTIFPFVSVVFSFFYQCLIIFKVLIFLPLWLNLFLVFYSFGAIISGIIFLFLFLIVHESATNFCMLILYPVTLLNSFIIFRVLCVCVCV